jgi:hypothetical protein
MAQLRKASKKGILGMPNMGICPAKIGISPSNTRVLPAKKRVLTPYQCREMPLGFLMKWARDTWTLREKHAERERPPNLATNGKRVVKHSKVDIQPLDLPMSLGGFNCCWTFNSHHMTVLTKLIKIHRPTLAFGIQDILRWEVKRAQVASNEPS